MASLISEYSRMLIPFTSLLYDQEAAECRRPGTSGLTWKRRLTQCSVQIEITVSAFSNPPKCVQNIKKYL